MRRLLCTLLAVAVLAGGIGQVQADYIFTMLPEVPGGLGPLPFGINGSGQIVGTYDNASTGQQPFLLSGATYTTLMPSRAIATGINDTGQIVLTVFGTIEMPGNHAYLLSGGALSSLDRPGDSTAVSGINNRGQIVGNSSLLGAFVLSGGTYTRIAFPGADATFAGGINDAGHIVGQYSANNIGHGFVLSGSSFTTLDVPGSIYTYAIGINSSGQIVGNYLSPDQRFHGFLFSGDSYTSIDVPGAFTTSLSGINDSGEIVGSYFDRSTGLNVGFLATPTPEPATLLLLGVGILFLTVWAWRQKRCFNEATFEPAHSCFPNYAAFRG